MVKDLSPQVLGEEAFDAAWSTLVHMGALVPAAPSHTLDEVPTAAAATGRVPGMKQQQQQGSVVLYQTVLPLPDALKDAFA
jgi:hypothetical protein